MKLYLRDINHQMAEAWGLFFANEPDVEISHGDIFDQPADAIVSPANSFGFMDGGIDLVYSDRFGWELQNDLQDLIRNEHHGELPVGQAVIVPIKGDETYRWLVIAPTMRVPMNVSGTVNAYLAFRATLRAVLDHNRNAGAQDQIRSILCPGLGTAIGRMPAAVCSQQMFLAWRLVMRGDPLDFLNIGCAYTADRRLRGVL
jgi:O-acetyl-ADP-ribose deacetylase (regulator of RNase III)